MNVLRVFTASVAFFGIFPTFTKISNLENFSKNPVLFHRKPKIWTSLEVVLFRSHSTVICYIFQFLETEKTPKIHLCFKKKPKPGRFEKSYFFRTHYTSISLFLAICKEIKFFHSKIQVFIKTKQTLHVLKVSLFQWPSKGKLQRST